MFYDLRNDIKSHRHLTCICFSKNIGEYRKDRQQPQFPGLSDEVATEQGTVFGEIGDLKSDT